MKNLKKKFFTLFIDKRDDNYIQFLRYIIVSAICLLTDSLFLVFFTEIIKLHYLISGIIGYTIGLILNYILSITWVFHKKKYKNKLMEFAIFNVIGLLGMGLNEFFLWFFTELFFFPYIISRGISAILGYMFRFLARKYALFNVPAKKSPTGKQTRLS